MKEAEKIADKMSYREAVMNCLCAKCVPYRKATKIKMNRLLENIDNDKPLWKSDEHFINACNESYQQGKADKEKELLERIKELESRVSELESACSALVNGYA